MKFRREFSIHFSSLEVKTISSEYTDWPLIVFFSHHQKVAVCGGSHERFMYLIHKSKKIVMINVINGLIISGSHSTYFMHTTAI